MRVGNPMKGVFRRKTLLAVFIAIFAISALPGNLMAQFSGGSGTSADPYLISKAQDLVTLATDVNGGTTYSGKYFKVTQDIDMSSVSNFTPIGYIYGTNDNGTISTTGARAFQGTFDGDNKTISNLTINQKLERSNSNSGNGVRCGTGLFGYVNNGTIKNVVISHANISAELQTLTGYWNSATKASGVGALVGMLWSGSVENCSVSNSSISATATTTSGGTTGYIDCVGGLVGGIGETSSGPGNYNATVSGCSSYNNTVVGGTYVGGLSGEGDGSNITDFDFAGNTVVATNNNGQSGAVTGRDPSFPEGEANAVTLYVGKWNFIGSIGSTFDILNSNNGGKAPNGKQYPNDMAAIGFNYFTTEAGGTANQWSSVWYHSWNTMVPGQGYFVWPFDKSRIDVEGNDSKTEGFTLDNTTTSILPTALKKGGTVGIADALPGKDEYTAATNYATTEQAANGRWFALSNPFAVNLSVAGIVGY